MTDHAKVAAEKISSDFDEYPIRCVDRQTAEAIIREALDAENADLRDSLAKVDEEFMEQCVQTQVEIANGTKLTAEIKRLREIVRRLQSPD